LNQQRLLRGVLLEYVDVVCGLHQFHRVCWM
jgi:hypothetical protein